MDKKEIYGILAALFFTGILFSPVGTKIGIWLFVFGLIFGMVWFFKK